MGIGAITVPTAGAVTAPTDVPYLAYPSPSGVKTFPGLPLSSVLVPYDKGVMVMFANGHDPLRHWAGGSFLRTGLPAPGTAPTATPTGTRATCLLDIDVSSDGAYTIADGNAIEVRGYSITFKTTMSTAAGYQVLIGGSSAQALLNLQAMLDGAAGFGTTYQYRDGSGTLDESQIETAFGVVEVSAISSTAMTIRAKAFGTGGNAYTGGLVTGTWTDCSMAGSGTVGISGYFTGGAAGTGTAPAAGSFVYGFAHYRDTDNAFSGLSPTVTAVSGQAQNINLAAMTQSAVDSSTTHVVWFRSTVDGTEAELWRGEYVARSGTTDTDDIEDDVLTGFGATLYDERVYRSYRGGLPKIGRWLAYHLGAVFTGGAEISAPYTQGTANVSNGSASVTLSSGAYPTDKMIGRAFRVTDDNSVKTYRILYVSSRTLTLDTAYEGANDSAADYSIVDDRDPYEGFWSEPGLPNAWPATQSRKGAGGADNEGLTAIVPMWGALHFFTRDGIFRLTGTSASSLVMNQVVYGIGCVSGHTVVGVDGALYWLAADGIYAWSGDGDPVRISNPPADMASGIHDTIRRINMAHWRWFQTHYDEDDRVIRFLVALDDAVLPSHAIVLDIQARTWSLDTMPGMTRLASMDYGSTSGLTLGGDDAGRLWLMDTGLSDGGYGVEPVVALTGLTRLTGTAASTPFGTAGDYDGASVVLVGTDTGVFVRNRIASHTSSVLTFVDPVDTTLASSWTVVLGGVLLKAETGHFDLGISDEEWTLHKVDLAFEPSDDGYLYIAVGADRGALAKPEFGDASVDLTETDGHGRLEGGRSGKAHRLAFYAVEPGCEVVLRRFELTIGARGRVKVPA